MRYCHKHKHTLPCPTCASIAKAREAWHLVGKMLDDLANDHRAKRSKRSVHERSEVIDHSENGGRPKQ